MGGSSSAGISRLTAPNFEIERFLGIWYEIAHMPNPLESPCDTATIEFGRDYRGNLRLSYSCKREGLVVASSSRAGSLRVLDPNVPSKMQVKFDNWTSWSWSDYWVYETDYQSYAIVGNTKGYVWILSRTPTMSFCEVKPIRDKILELGFDGIRLVYDFNVLTQCTGGERLRR